jgi:hypothetical protein
VTVERGAPWGAAGRLPPDGMIVSSDAAARTVVEEHRRRGAPLPTLGLVGGDLCRTLGGRGDVDRLRSPDATTFMVDIGSVLVDGHLHWFVAHLIARRSWWRGRIVAVMNAQWMGRWDLGPRAHPGDGLLDITDADLSIADRVKARKRLPAGNHIPHPDIEVRRVAAWHDSLSPPLDIWLDGTRLGRAANLSVRIEPDALTVVV